MTLYVCEVPIKVDRYRRYMGPRAWGSRNWWAGGTGLKEFGIITESLGMARKALAGAAQREESQGARTVPWATSTFDSRREEKSSREPKRNIE